MPSPNRNPALPCHAVLLAAGSGKRLGLPKALLELQGHWMLPRIVSALFAGGCESVHVVVRPEEVPIIQARGGCGDAVILPNPHAEAGRTGSILLGLEEIPMDDALLIHPCDIPLLSAGVVSQLLGAWRGCSQPQDLLVRPVTPGGKGGHPLLLGARQVAVLRGYSPDRTLRDLLRASPERILNVLRRGDPGPFLDVDTPEQLALLESLL